MAENKMISQEVCLGYGVCTLCGSDPSLPDQNTLNEEDREQRLLQIRKMLDLLVHSSLCRSSDCQYPNCRKIKGLFRHGIECRTRADGGCFVCKKLWYLLQLHARACKESECCVPRCRDLKEHLRMLKEQSDSRRRAAVTELMKQKGEEVIGDSGSS